MVTFPALQITSLAYKITKYNCHRLPTTAVRFFTDTSVSSGQDSNFNVGSVFCSLLPFVKELPKRFVMTTTTTRATRTNSDHDNKSTVTYVITYL